MKKLLLILGLLAIPSLVFASSAVTLTHSVTVRNGTYITPTARFFVDYNGLVLWDKLNEGSGSSTIDGSGNRFVGTWTGSPSGTSGYYSPALIGPWAGAFNGSSTYVSLATSPSLLVTSGSYSAWIKASSTQNANARIVELTSSATANRLSLFVSSGAPVFFIFNNSSTTVNIAAANNSVTDGNWHHVAATWDASGATLYLDGVSKATFSGNATSAISSTTLVARIGEYGGGGSFYFNGLIQDVRIYNRVLPASEILQMYNYGNQILQ